MLCLLRVLSNCTYVYNAIYGLRVRFSDAEVFYVLAPVSLSIQLLSTGACRFLFMWRGHMSVYRCFTKTRRREMWDENLLFESGSKHPADVPFKKSSGHVRHIKCPHALKTFLKSATHFLKPGKCLRSDTLSRLLRQLAKPDCAAISFRKKKQEPPWKALNVDAGKTVRKCMVHKGGNL